MNLKTKTRAVSGLIRWFLANDEKKKKLHGKITESFLYKKNLTGERREQTKVTCYASEATPIGAYFITPGLHPLGVDHERFKDLCSMLASLGYRVYAPYLVDYRFLYIKPSTYDDYASSFDLCLKDLEEKKLSFKMNIFSISFGSLMSLRLAGDKKRRESLNSVIIFGGFGSWKKTCDDIIEKALFGQKDKGYGDLRSVPAIFNHVLEYADEFEEEAVEKLRSLWLKFMSLTWTDDSYLNRDKCLELAKKLACDLNEKEKSFFLKGCGLGEGTFQLYHELAKRGDFDHLNPLVEASHVTCAVYLLHGKYDCLIPSTEQKVIKEALPAKVIKRQILTKLYAHTARSEEGSVFMRLLGTLPELRNLIGIFLTISLPNPSQKGRKKLFRRGDKKKASLEV